MDMNAMVLEDIKDADMILVGIGEEFREVKYLKQADAKYEHVAKFLEEEDMKWVLPAYQDYLCDKYAGRSKQVLQKLADLLKNKNYFVVSTATNADVYHTEWKREMYVMPCGTSLKLQCAAKCEDSTIIDVTPDSRFIFDGIFDEIEATDLNLAGEEGKEFLKSKMQQLMEQLPVCPVCGAPMVYNNVYAENYDEAGYMEKWQLYTKWLQGSINRKLVLLELGVGMQFPSVIRFPFEKVAYFNQKAKMYRVNASLYQMTEELKEKGISISENAIDWLEKLC